MTVKKWNLIFTREAEKKFLKLDKPVQKQFQKYIQKILNSADPRSFGKPLKCNLAGLWRYRIGNYRMICVIEDSNVLITTVDLNHRKDIYESH
ncbi:MAG: type II toxin-antitoxin system RelE/ParE family toxin [Simkaniaceae bacterium]|nr:type II toxin-antitoxin system RelE/ParE family toxin [Simkaniaceae bacterium]